jgi:branched-chain amino acid transport system ATP-binding protein
MAEPILQIRNLEKRFGGLTAVSDVSYDAYEGEVTGLIGPNGAGKTTSFNLITGTYAPTSGDVVFDGKHITGLSPNRVVAHGLARTFQSATTFPRATVRENILRGVLLRKNIGVLNALFNTAAARSEQRAARETVDRVMETLDLKEFAEREAGTLAYGHQKRLGVAIGLATQPKLLLLDEPAAGLNPEEVDRFSDMLVQIRREYRLSLLIVEHHMRLIMRLCDRIVVLEYGKKIAEGTPEQIRGNPDVIKAYLGAENVH